MRLAYFDCFAGISGDMTLGALVDAGVDLACLREELAKLPVSGYSLEARVVKRGGFRGTKVNVIVDEKAQPPRRYTDIVAMISESTLDSAVQQGALDIFHRLGEVEARLHDEPLDTIHFHEVGGVDSIVDVVGAVIGLRAQADNGTDNIDDRVYAAHFVKVNGIQRFIVQACFHFPQAVKNVQGALLHCRLQRTLGDHRHNIGV